MNFWKKIKGDKENMIAYWIDTIEEMEKEEKFQEVFDICLEAMEKLGEEDERFPFFRTKKGHMLWLNEQYKDAEEDFMFGLTRNDQYSIESLVNLYLIEIDKKFRGINHNNTDYGLYYKKENRFKDACVLMEYVFKTFGEEDPYSVEAASRAHMMYALSIFDEIKSNQYELFKDLVVNLLRSYALSNRLTEIKDTNLETWNSFYHMGKASEILSYLPKMLDKDIEAQGLYSTGEGTLVKTDDGQAEIAGVFLDEKEEIKKATFWYGKALNLSPKNEFLLSERGWFFKNIGKIERAKDDFEELLEINPKHEQIKLFYRSN